MKVTPGVLSILSTGLLTGPKLISAATCGNGSRGDGVCADGTCCSQYGWCGTTSEHCSGTGTCGNGSRGNGVCADGRCCSQYGWCGTTSEHCSGTGTCGNGSRGNGVCADGRCCSQYGWCGTTSEHCSGIAPSPTSGGTKGYVTYHNYYAGEPLDHVSCSNGDNGLIKRWGYSTIDPMAPYVAAVSNIEWNSPNCGKCYQIVGWAKTIYVTAIDQCGAGPSGETHFDIHPDGYRELMGDAGVTAGSGYVTYKEVASSYCKGNKG